MQEQRSASGTHEKPQIIFYTAITGGKNPDRNDIVCFTQYNKFVAPVLNAKIYKILPHQFLDCDISVWMDGNVEFLGTEEDIIEWLGDNDICLFKHPDRDCIFEEARAAAGLFEKDETKKEILEHGFQYKTRGVPEHIGLGECNFIIRRHNNRVESFNNYWWSEICKHSFRDQLSFPIALKKSGVKVKYLTDGNVRTNPKFKYTPHSHNV